ncbi:hypothetical protein V1527DRAFT_493168 [Lipomyces starkeyi]
MAVEGESAYEPFFELLYVSNAVHPQLQYQQAHGVQPASQPAMTSPPEKGGVIKTKCGRRISNKKCMSFEN